MQVMSIKAVGIAIKLTVEGSSQAGNFETWVFVMVSISCIIIQLNYLNKVKFFVLLPLSLSLSLPLLMFRKFTITFSKTKGCEFEKARVMRFKTL